MARPFRVRSRPKIAALLAIAVIFLGAGVALFTGGRARSHAGGVGADSTPTGPITDISAIIGDTGAGHGRLQFVDPRNPSRISREIEYERLDPLPQGRFTMTEPRAWVYLPDGRVLYVRARSGKIKKPPKSNDVESGQFEGWVVALLFAARPGESAAGEGGRHIINPDTDTPLLVAVTESLAFDRTTGEFSTDDSINISTPDWELQGVGLRGMFNDVLQRPGPSTIVHGRYVLFKNSKQGSSAPTPLAAKPAPGAPAPGDAQPDPSAAPAPSHASTAGKEVFYDIDFRDSVVFIKDARSVASDSLEIWARVVDGHLAPGALGEQPKERNPATGEANADAALPNGTDVSSVGRPIVAAPPVQQVAKGPAAAPRPGVADVRQTVLSMRQSGVSDHPPLTTVEDDDGLLLWTGPLTVTPLDATPAQLNFEQVALRFAANPGREVTLTDSQRAQSGRCTVIDYGATTQNLLMSGVGEAGVSLMDPASGALHASRFEQNLRTGDAHVPGAGMLVDKAGVRQVTWNDQADFNFETARGHTADLAPAGFSGIREAMFAGGVVASDERSMAGADFLHAWFRRPETGKGGESLDRVVLEGHAHGQKKGKDTREVDRLRADRIDVGFKAVEGANRSDPSILTATGSVEASRTELLFKASESTSHGDLDAKAALRTSTLSSDMLEAALGADPSDPKTRKIEITTATAQGHFHFERTDGLAAEAEVMRADALAKVVDLTGDNMVLSQGPSRITGTQARLDGGSDALLVFGAGAFDQDGASSRQGGAGATSHVTWTKSMRFENTKGLVECVGEATAVSVAADGRTRNRAQGERITLHLGPEAKKADRPAETSILNMSDNVAMRRPVELAEIFGAPGIPGGAPARPAQIESRHYAEPLDSGADRRLDGLKFVEGMTITADNKAGLFSVPTAGRALIVDTSEKPSNPVESVDKSPGGVGFPDSTGSRGNSLFTWTGSMVMDHSAGRLEMRDGVRLIHKPLGNGTPTLLDCDSLTALFQTTGRSGDRKGELASQRLLRALAHGDVTAQTEDGVTKLLAGDIDYDVTKGEMDAWSPDGERVTFFDEHHTTPLIARKLHYNKVTGDATIVEPLPIAVPIVKKK